MENQFKLRISRMFRSSFGSCKSKNINDVIEKPDDVIINHDIHNHRRPQNSGHQHSPELFLLNFSSICRPRCINVTKSSSSNNNKKKNFSFPSVIRTSERIPLLPEYSRDSYFFEGQKCPPASPASPYYNNINYNFKHNLKKKKNNKKTAVRKRAPAAARFNGGAAADVLDFYHPSGLHSTDDDEEEEDKTTLFSSTKSLSSDSSTSFRRRVHKNIMMSPTPAPAPATMRRGGIILDGKLVKGSFAVVKHSRDPYTDFRRSMVEMIIEKKIFSGEDLEKLLQCFLSLNSYYHHNVIIQVFTDILDALFCNFS